MPEHAPEELDVLLRAILEPAASPEELEARVRSLGRIRRRSRSQAEDVERRLLARLQRLDLSVRQTRHAQEELRGLLARMTAPPWHPARFLRSVPMPDGVHVLVHAAGGQRVVPLAAELDPASLRRGDAVFLNEGLNLVVANDPVGQRGDGDTSVFDRALADGRIVVRWRDEELVLEPVDGLNSSELRTGDRLRIDRGVGLAFERVGAADGEDFLLEDVPDLPLSAVGGDGEALGRLLSALTANLLDPARARRYGLAGRPTILLHGPPGCGKTLRARVAAAEIRRRSGRRCRLAVVRPGEFESPWVGESEARIRSCFARLRAVAAEDGLGILFLDEVESVTRIRGAAGAQHADRSLGALLAEIDGFMDRGAVAVVAATNRKELLDPAFLSRISEVEIRVDRPDRREARAIFGVHLGPDLPFAPGVSREELIEIVLSRLYAPNADNGLGSLHFRDGRTRPVVARDLGSGRLFEQICRQARERAFAAHESRGADAGIGFDDVECAVDDAIERLATTLTARNARSYLLDLPEDAEIVRVERMIRRVRHPHRFVEAA